MKKEIALQELHIAHGRTTPDKQASRSLAILNGKSVHGHQVGTWLKQNYSSVRAIGFDFISLSSYQNRVIGRESRRVLLGGEKHILIIEDMKLDEIDDHINKLFILPLRVSEADGPPCNVIAQIE